MKQTIFVLVIAALLASAGHGLGMGLIRFGGRFSYAV